VSRLIFIVGGCRSGKSAYAHKLACAYARVAYLATAVAQDTEMLRRIADHRRVRPAHWLTIEEPLKIAAALKELDEGLEAVILDCLTLYLNNLITASGIIDKAPADYTEYKNPITQQLDEIIHSAKNINPVVIIVSNELGTGIVPPDPVSRFFRDMMGLMNQRLAQEADEVYKLEVGIPVKLK
jgi:adenosylcobinamide kinase/adenosylcobinamide-phosphate guanylyltransferase